MKKNILRAVIAAGLLSGMLHASDGLENLVRRALVANDAAVKKGQRILESKIVLTKDTKITIDLCCCAPVIQRGMQRMGYTRSCKPGKSWWSPLVDTLGACCAFLPDGRIIISYNEQREVIDDRFNILDSQPQQSNNQQLASQPLDNAKPAEIVEEE